MSTKYEQLQMFYKKINPTAAGLIGAGLGWMLSDTLVETPRGNMTPQQQREWERLIERTMKRRGIKKLIKDGIHSYEIDITEVQKGDPRLQVPPKAGLVFDPAKHRWAKPESVGKTVTEVQGKKRYRASGTGAEAKRLEAGRIGGKGGRASAIAGRKSKTELDVGDSKKSALDRFKSDKKKK